MSKTTRGILNIYWDNELVGHLCQTAGQGMSFQYSTAYLAAAQSRAISLTLPLRAAAFPEATSWFANLLPEGEIRGHIARRFGISERNEFAILKAIGGECAGALRLLPDSSANTAAGELHPLPWDELEARIASSSRPSLLALALNETELRLSLAGAQDKLPVHLCDGQLALPSGSSASTHLLKIASGGLPDLVQNELFCLTLARLVGLDIPHAEMAKTKTPILLIKRYDRVISPEGQVLRLHQEDFCQALGVPAESKYENEGGPSLAQIFAVLARGSRNPLPDKRDLLTWVLFNYIIGNADTHAKNISLLYGRPGTTDELHLAPFYDLVCTEVYDHLSKKLAQKIGGEYRHKYIASRHWDRFAAAIGVKPKYLHSLGLELCRRIEETAPALAAETDRECSGRKTLDQILQVIEKRLAQLRRELRR